MRSRLLFPRLSLDTRWKLWGSLLLFLAVMFENRSAFAFANMIRHGYTTCTPCHVDPSGAGTLSNYGREIEEEALRTPYPGEHPGEGDSPRAGFLWGAVNIPEWLLLQGDVRYLRLAQKIEDAPLSTRGIWMQLDFAAGVQVNHFTALGSLGYAPEGALAASLTRGSEKNLTSRQHWLGYSALDDRLMIRAGRMNLPFGLRVYEHTLWARQTTRTSINDDQQYGLSVGFRGDRFRGEVMGIVGNFQLRPDDFRERGYSAFAEVNLLPQLTLGASSLATHRDLHPQYLKETWRQVHGVFTRYGTPWKPLVLLAEWDYSFESPKYAKQHKGFLGFLQADLEMTQGMHVLLTGEASNVGVNSPPFSLGAWLSYAWFFAPHADLRVDSIYQNIASSFGNTSALSFLLQGHVYL